MGRIYLVLALAIVAFTACASDTDADADADSDGDGDLFLPYGDAIVIECQKRATCAGFTLNECIEGFLENGTGGIHGYASKQMFFNRRECMAAAQDCDAVDDCYESTNTAYWENIPPEPCEGFPEFRCVDDTLILCPEDDGYPAVEPTHWVFELDEMDKVCDSSGFYAADPGNIACMEDEYPQGNACNGRFLETCINGEALSYDCAHVDPEFVCTLRDGDNAFCTMPQVEDACVGIVTDVHDSGGRCNGNVAEFCVSGKYFQIDCDDFLDVNCDAGSTGYVYCR